MDPKPDDPLEFFATAAAFERWLRTHHAKAACVWIKYAKKKSGVPSIDWDQAVDVALCYGWIDGQKQTVDSQSYKLRFLPRRPRSVWSKLNTQRVERLIAEGRMREPGLEQVAAAKADGRWEAAYDSGRTSTVPPDFQSALDESPAAAGFWRTLEKRNTYAILWRIQTAKKPETRAKRIRTFIDMLAKGEKLHP